MKTLAAAFILAAVVAVPAFAADPCTDPALVAKAVNAQSLAKAKQYAQAEPLARAVVAVCPTQPTGVAALGESLAGQRKYADAVSALSTALAAKPDLAYAYFWRGQSYYGLKQKDKMVTDFSTFLKLAPTAPEATTVKQLLATLQVACSPPLTS